MGRPITDVQQYIRDRVAIDETTGCWIWQRGLFTNGYGQASFTRRPGRSKRAHRVSYEAFVGPVPDDLVIDHLCRNKLCCNPEHLEPVTSRENAMRSPLTPSAQNAARERCFRCGEYY